MEEILKETSNIVATHVNYTWKEKFVCTDVWTRFFVSNEPYCINLKYPIRIHHNKDASAVIVHVEIFK